MSHHHRAPLVACIVAALAAAAPVAAQDPNLGAMTFFPLAPCRILDTRAGSGVQGAGEGPLSPGVAYSFDVSGGDAACGVHAEARGVLLNFVVVRPGGAGHLTVWPWDSPAPPAPVASILNFDAGRTVANGVAVRICHRGSAVSTCAEDLFAVLGGSSAHLVVDVLGYYGPPCYGPLWGEGRPGVVRHGTSGLGTLCSTGDVRFGLSNPKMALGSAAAACPAGTWVCSFAERGTALCDTVRPDATCDWRECSGSCIDAAPGQHLGWVADAPLGGSHEGTIVNETGDWIGAAGCLEAPVWCCSAP